MPLLPEDLAALRRDYSMRGLRRSELAADPFTQFASWLNEASARGLMEPNAMTLATVDAEGQPWSRTVLLKTFDARGFAFFTNYDGTKAQHLAANPRAALTFWWNALERQVNIAGSVEKTSAEESDAYFASRPAASRLGAWASRQSSVLSGREDLEQAFAAARERFPDDTAIPRPEHWGGYRVVPCTVEFWQGRQSRLHDRLRYVREGDGWRVERLAP